MTFRIRGNGRPLEKVHEIIDQLSGIGGRNSIGFGPNRVRSVPDAIALALSRHFNGSSTTSNLQAGAVMAAHNPDPTPAPADNLTNGLEAVVETKRTDAKADLCPMCGAAAFVHEEGCSKCYSCGHSEC